METDQKVAELLDTLATKMGTTVEYLWPLLVKHQAVTSWVGVIFGGAVFVALVAAGVWMIRRSWRASDHDMPGWIAGSLVALFLAAVGLCVSIDSISNALVPEAAVLKSLMSSIK